MANQFSCHEIFDKAYINSLKSRKQLIKTVLTNKVLTLLSKKKKKLDYKNDDGTFTCLDCNKIVPQLNNAHIGPTQSYMIDDVLKNFENEQKDIIEYWNDYCDMHKFVKIAVCCPQCNTEYEGNNLSKIKMNIEFITHSEIEVDISDENSDFSVNDTDNRTIKSLFRSKIKKIDEYPPNIIELFKDFKDKIINSEIGATSKPLKEKQAEEYIRDLDILFNIIGLDKLYRIFDYHNKKEYIPIIDIIKEANEKIENHEIKKEWKRKKKKQKKENNPFLYATPFNKCIIKLLIED